MTEDVDKEIEQALTKTLEDRILETPISQDRSPLTQSVKMGNIADVGKSNQYTEESKGKGFRAKAESEYANQETQKAVADAPEQQIGEDYNDVNQNKNNPVEEATISTKQAMQTAQALLGMADNLLAVGGGFFIKIRKHEEFYEFEELVEVVDSQNDKNIKRIKLDEEDKALLTPLLAQVIQNKSKQLTPEQQLLGAVISVIVKKAQTVMEMRSENKTLEARILQIVRESKDTVVTDDIEADQTVVTDIEEPLDDVSQQQFEEQFDTDPIAYNEMPTEEITQVIEHPSSNQAMGMDVVYEEVVVPQTDTKDSTSSKEKTTKTTKQTRSKTPEVTVQQEEEQSDSDDTS